MRENLFRRFYYNFCIVEMPNDIRKNLIEKNWPDLNNADYVLVYGSVDTDERLLWTEIMCTCRRNEDGSFSCVYESQPYDMECAAVAFENCNYYTADRFNGIERFSERAEKIKNESKASKEIEASRQCTLLDDFRDKFFPDVIKAILFCDGNLPETCRVEINSLEDKATVVGVLLDDPEQDFGVYSKNGVTLNMYTKDYEVSFWGADMNIHFTGSDDDFYDGRILRHAIDGFTHEPDEETLSYLLYALCRTPLYIPCEEIDGYADYSDVIDMNDSSINTITRIDDSEDASLVPEIIADNDDNRYLPLFTNLKALGQYNNDCAVIMTNINTAIKLAQNSEEFPTGIAIDVSSDNQFVFGDDKYKSVQDMYDGINKEANTNMLLFS